MAYSKQHSLVWANDEYGTKKCGEDYSGAKAVLGV